MNGRNIHSKNFKLCYFNVSRRISREEASLLLNIPSKDLYQLTSLKTFSSEDLYKLIIRMDFDDYYADFLQNNPDLFDELLSGYILFQELCLEGQNLDVNKFGIFVRGCLIDHVCIHKSESFAKELFKIIAQAHYKLNRKWSHAKKRRVNRIGSSPMLRITHIHCESS